MEVECDRTTAVAGFSWKFWNVDCTVEAREQGQRKGVMIEKDFTGRAEYRGRVGTMVYGDRYPILKRSR